MHCVSDEKQFCSIVFCLLLETIMTLLPNGLSFVQELFVEMIAKDALVYAQQGKRKTLQRKDLGKLYIQTYLCYSLCLNGTESHNVCRLVGFFYLLHVHNQLLLIF